MTTPLRQRMIDDLKLAGYSARTQESYVATVRRLSEHYSRSPDQINEEELRQYFLFMKNIRKFSHTAFKISICGIKFFLRPLWAGIGVIFDLSGHVRRKSFPWFFPVKKFFWHFPWFACRIFKFV